MGDDPSVTVPVLVDFWRVGVNPGEPHQVWGVLCSACGYAPSATVTEIHVQSLPDGPILTFSYYEDQGRIAYTLADGQPG